MLSKQLERPASYRVKTHIWLPKVLLNFVRTLGVKTIRVAENSMHSITIILLDSATAHNRSQGQG